MKYRFVKEGEVLQEGDEWQPVDPSFALDFGVDPGVWYALSDNYYGVKLQFGAWGNIPSTVVIRRKLPLPRNCKVCNRDIDPGCRCWWCGNE